jgi:acyl carrier protein
MMTDDQAFAIVCAAIVNLFQVPAGSVTRETTANDVPGWDSFAHGQLIMEVETKVGRPLPVDRLFEAGNVGEFIRVLSEA